MVDSLDKNSLSRRQKLILDIVIREHIKSATPVGSSVIVDKYKLDISPATVRNEMVNLEKRGFIIQPYTSAGRIPTEKAYSMYLDNLKPNRLSSRERKDISLTIRKKDELSFKETAKILAALSGNAAFWAFSVRSFYYTGISNLWQQPEFRQINLIYNISVIIDQLDTILADVFNKITGGIHILIGSHNPFGDFCGTVLAKYSINGQSGLFGILGPMRMNYEKIISLVDFTNQKLIDGR